MIISAIGQMADFAEGLRTARRRTRRDRDRPGLPGQEDAEALRRRRRASARICSPRRSATAASPPRRSAISSPAMLGETPARRSTRISSTCSRSCTSARLDPASLRSPPERGARTAKTFAIHNYEDRGATQIIPHTRCSRGISPMSRARRRDERHVEADKVLGDFGERIVGFQRGAGAQGGRALHELRHVLRMRQLRHLLPADGGAARAEEGARGRPLRLHRLQDSASAATSAWTSARPATSRWASGSSRWRGPLSRRSLAALVRRGGGGRLRARRRARPAARRCRSIPKGKGDHCVRDTAFMRRYHMMMLKHQRDDTVHEGVRGGDFSIRACVDCHAVNGAGRAAGRLCRSEAFLPLVPRLRGGLDRLFRVPRLEARNPSQGRRNPARGRRRTTSRCSTTISGRARP